MRPEAAGARNKDLFAAQVQAVLATARPRDASGKT